MAHSSERPASEGPGLPQLGRTVPDRIDTVPAVAIAAPNNAVITRDLHGRITSWNADAERIFGYPAGAMIGVSGFRLFPAGRRKEEEAILARILAGAPAETIETTQQTSDGRSLQVSAQLAPIRDRNGQVIGISIIARDITEIRSREREIARLSRLYAALSEINQAIVKTASRPQLFERICRLLVDQGGFVAAWIGWHDPAAHRLVPSAYYGLPGGSQERITRYLEQVAIYTDDRAEARGPTGTAFRTDRPLICNDLLAEPSTAPWRAAILASGWRASAALPIRVAGTAQGVLTVYAQEVGFFRDKEEILLREAASDISFALDHFAIETHRLVAEQAVQNERNFSAALIDSLPGVFYAYEESGKFLRWNRNFEQVSGFSGEEISVMHPADFFDPSERKAVLDRITDVFQLGFATVEANFRAKDGTLTPYYFTGTRADIAGRRCLVGVGIDITARKQSEQARQAAEDASRAAQAELARMARISLLGEFAASVAHEINQPLAAIATNGAAATRWLAAVPPHGDKARDCITRIEWEAHRASDIIQRMRGFVTRAAPADTRLDLNQMVGEIVEFVEHDLRNDTVTLHTDLAPDLPAIRGDRIQLQQVLLNLVINAIEAMRPVTDRPRVMRIATAQDPSCPVPPGGVRVLIEDSGTGFDAAAAEQLFGRFFTTKLGGTGLGLAIARSIIEHHGGRIWAEPAPALRGAIFQFSLPAATEGSA
ncbi:MAG: PAS domain S-box protein [Rhodospirillales bacterium]|nr:PAS domain S-box protein [Rhodospirillales bacterium]